MNTIATTVTTRGMNWSMPSLKVSRYRSSFVSLCPTMIRIAAKQERGVRFRKCGTKVTAKSNKSPWIKEDFQVRPPEFTFAEVRSTTEVMGMPPIIPEQTFPTPWAHSSRFGEEMRRYGSIRSAASSESSVSILATIAMVTDGDCGRPQARGPESGEVREGEFLHQVLRDPAGKLTRCAGFVMYSPGANRPKPRFIKIPRNTTINGPGTS